MNKDDRRPKVFFSPTSREVRILGFTIRAATILRIQGAIFTFLGVSWLVESCLREELLGWWGLVKVGAAILLVGIGILCLLARVVNPKGT